MPMYDYTCPKCGHYEEVWKPMSELHRAEPCPHCKKTNMHLVTAAPAFHLKGTGWYVTDYKNKGNKNGPKNDV